MKFSFLPILLPLVTTLFIVTRFTDGYRILAIFPFNGRSRAIFCQQLMEILARRGHQVDVISHYPLDKPVPNYHDLSIRGTMQEFTNNITYEEIENEMKPFLWSTILKKYTIIVCNILQHPVIQEIIKNPPNNPPYDVVFLEQIGNSCYLPFGRLLKVPIIGIKANPIFDIYDEFMGNPSSYAFIPKLYSDGSLNFWKRLKNLVLVKLENYWTSRYIIQQQEYVDKYFGPGYPRIEELSKEMILLFTNTHYTLNGVRPLTPAVVEVGGLHIQDREEKLSEELEKWLDDSKHGYIYVSFGSMVMIESLPKEILDIFYATFSNIAPVRVLMRVSKHTLLPDGLPANVKTFPWFPQLQVLKHKNIRAFVTHGGLMGTLESIYAAVPMIGFPLFVDQPYNLEICEQKGIAISLDLKIITEESFTKALRDVLNNRKYKDNIARLSKHYFDRLMSIQDTVVYWTEYVIRNGNVLRSPALDLAWWQIEMLDVYGFLLLLLIVSLFSLFLVMKLLYKCIILSFIRNKSISVLKKEE